MTNDNYSERPSEPAANNDNVDNVDNSGYQGYETSPRERTQQEEMAARRQDPVYPSAPPPPLRQKPPTYVRWLGGCLIALVAVMLLCGGGTAVLAAIAFNSTPASASVDKTFTLSGAPTVIVHSSSGSVHITPGSDNQIALHATKRVRAFTHAQAQSELDSINITATQSGNTVTIEVGDNDGFGVHLFNDRRVELNLTTPATTNLTVVENAGSLDATGLTGKLSAQVNAGSVTLNGMTLDDGSSLRVNAGSLSMDGALQPGASLVVNVNAGSADLTLPRDTSAHLDASASAGSVDVNGWSISESHSGAEMTASGDLNPNPTGTITIRVSAGSASLNAE